MKIKDFICSLCGVVGSAIAWLFGGWSSALETLIILMIIDYITGFIVAAVFNNSAKSDNGGLDSAVGWKGLAKKVMVLVFVLIGHRIDMILGVDYVQNTVVIGFMVNELLSIVENAGLMGLPLPTIILKAIDLLKERAERED